MKMPPQYLPSFSEYSDLCGLSTLILFGAAALVGSHAAPTLYLSSCFRLLTCRMRCVCLPAGGTGLRAGEDEKATIVALNMVND